MFAEDSTGRPPRLLDAVREAIRVRHYSRRTERAYVGWIRRFVIFHHRRHPRDMGGPEIAAFLSHLAVDGKVSASTQNQALSALLFLYRHVLAVELPWLEDVVRARRPVRLPEVLDRREVLAVLDGLSGTSWLVASLLYGSGLRLLEALRLRIKDVDLGRRELMVRDGKGQKDRVTMLPGRLVAPMQEHLAFVRRQHEQDLAAGAGWRIRARNSSGTSISPLAANSRATSAIRRQASSTSLSRVGPRWSKR